MKKKSKGITDEEAQTRRLEQLSERKRKALEDLADVRNMESELGMGEPGGEESVEGEMSPAVMESPRMTAILQETADGTFCVYKLERGQASKVGQFPIADWPESMETVAREASGGTFRIQFRRADGTQAAQMTQTFDQKFYKKEAPASSGVGDSVALLIESIKESKRDMLEMMKLMLGQNNGGLIKTASDLTSILPLFMPKQDKAASPETMIELFRTGLELGKEVRGEETSGSGSITERIVGHLVNALGKPLAAQVAGAMLAPPAPGVPGALPRSLTKPAPAAPSAPALPEETVADPSILKIKNNFIYRLYVPGLLAQAKEGADVEAIAEEIMNRLPESWDGYVLDLVSRPDVVEYFSLFEPSVKASAEWFGRLAACIKSKYETDDKAEAEKITEAVVAAV